MIEEPNLIYTDGHDVKVTADHFVVRNSTYLVNGITRAKMLIMKANKWVPVLFAIFGIALLLLGYYHVLTPLPEQSLPVGENSPITTEKMIEIIGGLLLIGGVIWLAVSHDKYVVRITTAEGDKDVIKSTRRDYVAQILSALNRATIPVV